MLRLMVTLLLRYGAKTNRGECEISTFFFSTWNLSNTKSDFILLICFCVYSCTQTGQVQGQDDNDDNAPPMRSKLTLWQHITATTWPNGHRVYYALEHDYISDSRIKNRAEEERKEGRT